MSSGRSVLLAVALVGAACSASDGDHGDGGGGGADADPLAPDGGGGGGDGGGGTGDAAAVALPSCWQTCGTSADCGTAIAVNDADNYACQAGACVFIGCRSTSECTSTYGAGWACGEVPSLPWPMCARTCGVPADCAMPTPLYDADNYHCTDGLCEFIGCTSHAECEAGAGSDYGCHARSGLGYPVCTPRCSSASDCVIAGGGPLYDADNYACEDGFCEWIGCNDAAECRTSLMSDEMICR